ncbi:Endonuclease IV [Candidatus Koribacter versatilis Ellin345]|uniref:Probable endonuclease 4 n=1 Tax=Koribacter versatilis (strain Ellin345) TaxID=204669 RepID=Q1IS22_KORVE|nr:deoxyribonuclease IV [Candidatus Koribacter versatilis]ABF40328.1 Endonuclease IV [Candidatus Koribacter versatilis Ellin345]
MPRAVSKKVEIDILKLIPPPKTPPKRTAVRIGIHTSSAGGVELAAERAYRLGCSCLQIFSSSPRQWKPFELGRSQCETMSSIRAKYDLNPLVIHANYLINVAGGNPEFHQKSIEAFRAEVQRGIDLCADYLVLHPGSFKGATREDGLQRAAEAIEAAVDGLGIEKTNLKITIENTAGSEFSLGGSFEQVAELMARLRKHVPVAACIDTCHTHVAGYDITTKKGFEKTLQQLDDTVGLKNVGVFHCNDAKAPRGSKLDRHQHIGQGTIGLEPFKWLLNDPRLQHPAFIAETPIDEPLDDLKNIDALKSCVKKSKPAIHHRDAEAQRTKK